MPNATVNVTLYNSYIICQVKISAFYNYFLFQLVLYQVLVIKYVFPFSTTRVTLINDTAQCFLSSESQYDGIQLLHLYKFLEIWDLMLVKTAMNSAYLMRHKQNGCHNTGDIFKCILFNEIFCILIKTTLIVFSVGPNRQWVIIGSGSDLLMARHYLK